MDALFLEVFIAFAFGVIVVFGVDLINQSREDKGKGDKKGKSDEKGHLEMDRPLRVGVGFALLVMLARALESLATTLGEITKNPMKGEAPAWTLLFVDSPPEPWPSVALQAMSAFVLLGVVLALLSAILKLFREE